MTRGILTTEANEIAKKLLGRKITQTELRLMPYIQFQMMNTQKIDPVRINNDERVILQLWRKEGHIEGGATGLAITKKFWDVINEILFITYVKRDFVKSVIE